MGVPEGVCAVVTGANAGIGELPLARVPCRPAGEFTRRATRKYCSTLHTGKEVTAGLMREGHHVIMACRNMQRCHHLPTSTIACRINPSKEKIYHDVLCPGMPPRPLRRRQIFRRCEEAREELKRRQLAGSCECMKVDLGDFASVRAFAKGLLKHLDMEHKKIKLLINNAGPSFPSSSNSSPCLIEGDAWPWLFLLPALCCT